MKTPIKIFLVEDNEGDIVLIQEALEETKLLHELDIARDGEEALIMLKDLINNEPKNLPDIIILDINLPKISGHEVLSEIKTNPLLRKIPVIIMTTSSSENDIANAYDLHANCYVIKSMDIEEFMNVIRKIENFWANIVKLPQNRKNENGS